MVQRLKVEIREEIVAAATSLFAEDGFEATSIAGVAARAGVSTGNVYRYFSSKDELFSAAVPKDFVAELRRRTKARIGALEADPSLELSDERIAPESRYAVVSEELVDFSLANRERVVIVLAKAEGTPFASFEEEFRRDLVDWAFAYVRLTWPAVRVTAPLRFAVDRAYRSFLSSLAAAFVEHDDPRRIRELVTLLGYHHRGGLLALFRTTAASARRSDA